MARKIDKLRAASMVAPKVRRGDGSRRRINVVDRDNNVIDQPTFDDLRKRFAERLGVQFGTNDETRPSIVACSFCHKPVKVKKTGVVPKTCPGGCSRECALCGVALPVSTCQQAARAGRFPTCLPCGSRAGHARTTAPRKGKLTVEQLTLIVAMLARGDTHRAIAARFGVSEPAVWNIASGRRRLPAGVVVPLLSRGGA